MSARDSGSDEARKAKPEQSARRRHEVGTFGAFVRKPANAPRGCDVSDEAQRWRIEPVESLPDDAVEVGAIVDAYGLKGWVKVAAACERGTWRRRHAEREALVAASRAHERKSARCVQSKVHSDTIVAHLGGCDDRDAALALRGHTRARIAQRLPEAHRRRRILLGRSDRPGCRERGGRGDLGQVADMIDNGAHSIMRIEYPATGKDGKPVTGERLIPFVGVYVKTVDQAAKQDRRRLGSRLLNHSLNGESDAVRCRDALS